MLKALPSQEALQALFEYDPVTGHLSNKVRRGTRALKGSIARGEAYLV